LTAIVIGMVETESVRGVRRRWLWHTAFVGGIGLSAVAAAGFVLTAYFAGTAPHLPASTAALENPSANRAWPAPVQSRPLDVTPAAAVLRSTPTPTPRAADPSAAPPIDLADLPPPDRSTR
jgi:hypothetical protein